MGFPGGQAACQVSQMMDTSPLTGLKVLTMIHFQGQQQAVHPSSEGEGGAWPCRAPIEPRLLPSPMHGDRVFKRFPEHYLGTQVGCLGGGGSHGTYHGYREGQEGCKKQSKVRKALSLPSCQPQHLLVIHFSTRNNLLGVGEIVQSWRPRV